MTARKSRCPVLEGQALAVASELASRQVRSTVIRNLTGLQRNVVSQLMKAVTGKSPTSGRMPSFAHTAVMSRQQAAGLSLFATMYLSLVGDLKRQSAHDILEPHATDPWLLLSVYDEVSAIYSNIDLTHAYITLRDLRARDLELRFCSNCKTHHLYWYASDQLDQCCFCTLGPTRAESQALRAHASGATVHSLDVIESRPSAND